ncbi:MAG: SDR family oxidoreductase [Roseiflexaceae bacterium]
MLLITGGSGYLGAELVAQASQAGMLVVASYHQHPPATIAAVADRVSWIPLDLRDATATEQAIRALAPTAIIHTAYLQNGPEMWAITAEGAIAVARAALACHARLIVMSSDVVFDGEKIGPYTEQDAPSPVSDYGRAKAFVEQQVAVLLPAALIVRTSLIYGGDPISKHEQLVLAAADGSAEIAFFEDELRCPVQVADLAAALLELLPGTLAGVLHLAGAETLSRYAFAQLVAAAHQRDPRVLRSARSADSPVRRPRNCALDSRMAQQQLRVRLRGATEVLSTKIKKP